MFRIVGAVFAAYAGYKYGDDIVKMLQKKKEKARIKGAPGQKSLDIDVGDIGDDDQFHYTDECFNGDSDESTSLRKSKYSFGKDSRRSHEAESNDIPLYERRNSRGDNVDQYGFRRSRSGNVSEKAYTLDIPVHSFSRKRDSLQDNEGESIVKEAVHVPAGDSQELQNVEPIKKWRRLSMEREEKVSPDLLRGLRSRFSFEADDKDLAEHFRDLSCNGGTVGGVWYASRVIKQSKSASELRGQYHSEKTGNLDYEVCGAKDPIFETEAEVMNRIRDVRLRGDDVNLASDRLGDGSAIQAQKEDELEEIECMSEDIYSKLHNEIVGSKSVDKVMRKLSETKVERSSRPNSRRSSADLDPSRTDSNFQRWVTLRTGINGHIVFWHSRGKLYDYLTGEALVNVEALDVTRGVSLSTDVMHQLSERIFVFRDRDSNEVVTDYKGVPLRPVRHSFSYTWNASQTFSKATKGAEDNYENLKVNVVAVRQPKDQSKLTFNCRISLTVDINQGKFQWHEIGDYDFKEVKTNPEEVYRCSMLYMGAIPPLSHIAVMHLSGWRVDDFNLLPASIKDHVQLRDISWIGQPTQ